MANGVRLAVPDLAQPAQQLLPALLLLGLTACGGSGGAPASESASADRSAAQSTADPLAELAQGLATIDAEAARIDSVFQPLPLLRPAEEEALRRFPNQVQLQRARALGIGRGLPEERLAELVAAGELVRLEDTRYWVVRGLDYSQPLVVPAVTTMLTEIGRRFQERLGELGAPPYRLEVSSVLRTPADQAALRRVNPNAALGESTHEYATTVDVLYSAYAAPAEPIAPSAGDAASARILERYAGVAAERVAGRRALELKAILGHVLLELQDEGRVMVTLERLQPVYHMTVAQAP